MNSDLGPGGWARFVVLLVVLYCIPILAAVIRRWRKRRRPHA